jgi:hypothetical protein
MTTPKIDTSALIRREARRIIEEHLAAFLAFYGYRLAKGTPAGYAKRWVKRWSERGVAAFVWLNTEAKGFSTTRALAKGFWGSSDASEKASKFFRSWREREIPVLADGSSEPCNVPPFKMGREYFFSFHGIAVSLGFRGLAVGMRDQVLATAKVAHAYTANLRGVVQQVIDDPIADAETKAAALDMIRSWGEEPKPKPQQTALFDRAANG